ncbi:NAD(P)/FAD-dependent oxidoreductase [Nocardioides sp.]|uniref:NAD(P)/FAD-dependent oxidoreductase n=1 Tax=Nocardioides sp. TaxID=35761 RepID=UPI003D0E1153
MRSTETGPIIVVGAGVIGLSTALHLREAMPERPIVVIEAGAVGDGTTPAGAGFVAPWATVLPHLGPAGLALAEHSLDLYRALAASGVELRFRGNGNIVLFNHQDSMDATVGAVMANPVRSEVTRVINAGEVSELTSGAVDAARVVGGIFMPGGIQLETGLLLAHLARLAVEAGIEIRPHTEVAALRTADGRIEGVELRLAADESPVSLQSDVVVLAVGAWLNPLLEQVGWRLPLLPFVATRFVTEDVGLAPTMPTIQAKDFPLWIRESEGGFTWGSTRGCAPAHRLGGDWEAYQPARRRRDDLVAAMTADIERVAGTFPALSGARTTAVIQGMPVYTVDRQFFAGEVPGCVGLWAVGGDNESGVSHGPGLGRLLADLITGSETPLCDATGYRLDRFAPTDFPDAEAVGQEFVRGAGGFIAEAMGQPFSSA